LAARAGFAVRVDLVATAGFAAVAGLATLAGFAAGFAAAARGRGAALDGPAETAFWITCIAAV
jgi:hypothetical protein